MKTLTRLTRGSALTLTALVLSLTVCVVSTAPATALAESAAEIGRFGPEAKLHVDASTTFVRQITGAQLDLEDVSTAAILKGFFAPNQDVLGVASRELNETRRDPLGDRSVVTFERRANGLEVIDGIFRVTLDASGRVLGYSAGDTSALQAPSERPISVEAARVAARAQFPGLVGEGKADQVYFQGRLAWRLRFAPALQSSAPKGSRTLWAPVFFIDADTSAVLGLRNGIRR